MRHIDAIGFMDQKSLCIMYQLGDNKMFRRNESAENEKKMKKNSNACRNYRVKLIATNRKLIVENITLRFKYFYDSFVFPFNDFLPSTNGLQFTFFLHLHVFL